MLLVMALSNVRYTKKNIKYKLILQENHEIKINLKEKK